ncbi:DUF421 domain-containing protein [Bacillus sp. CLL-7-23]|uniref:DUF421 domain-containing protein n=1 Tax=Bacillus changyiensis TaxID=3004103 RepID=A0ABT4X8C2_9BACI|nr:DUF421 domain-containing protein [Bacillus changyiensis]MDA7028547.1 DUF421 domain-containing protein [Bacillus changyiensis]
MSIFELSLRIMIAFVTLLILTRLMGRKELTQMTFFNFVSGIAIGTIGASLAIDSTLSIRNGLIALVGWSIITIALGFLDIKSKKARVLMEGQPRILIKKGKIMEDELRKVRLDIDALNTLLRKKNAFSISEVDYAIMETDGELSVLKKEPKQPLTKFDMGVLQTTFNVSPTSTQVITDGMINKSNLEKLNLNTQWLQQQLQSSGVHSVSDVFYAEVQKDGTLYIDKRNDVLH